MISHKDVFLWLECGYLTILHITTEHLPCLLGLITFVTMEGCASVLFERMAFTTVIKTFRSEHHSSWPSANKKEAKTVKMQRYRMPAGLRGAACPGLC